MYTASNVLAFELPFKCWHHYLLYTNGDGLSALIEFLAKEISKNMRPDMLSVSIS